MLYLVTSGPQAQRDNVLKAAATAGVDVARNQVGDPLEDDWGHHASHDTTVDDGNVVTVPSTIPTCFLTFEAAHPDLDFLDRYEWRLRAHFDKPPLVSRPPVVDVLARLGLTVDDLRTALKED